MTHKNNNIRIICVGCPDPRWPEHMRELCWRTNAEVVYWTATDRRQENLKSYFPAAVYHNVASAIRGIPAKGWENKELPPLHPEVLEYMLPYQLTALKMMERQDPDRKSFNYDEKLRLYNRHLRYWLYVLEESMPNLVIFPIAPHASYDYVIYGLCKYLKVDLILLERTALPGRILLGNSLEDPHERLSQKYGELKNNWSEKDITLQDYLEQHLLKLRGSYEQGIPANLKRKVQGHRFNQKAGRIDKFNFSKIFSFELQRFNRYMKLGKLNGIPNSYLKIKGFPAEEGEISAYRNLLYRIRAQSYKKRLEKHYCSLQTENPELKEKYLFLALHYQPERNTVPMGGWYADQLLIVQSLVAAIPEEWMIYVKEHPLQWNYFSKGELGRDKQLYNDLAAIPCVRLIPTEITSFDLIDHAQCVATVAGSSGWEAINRGKPALVFGHAWYKACEGVFPVNKQKDVDRAIRAISEGYKVCHDSVRLFLKALDLISINSVIEYKREDLADLTNEQIVQNIVDAFVKEISLLRGESVEITNLPSSKAQRVFILCENKTAAREFIPLAEKMFESKDFYPVIFTKNRLLRSISFDKMSFPLEIRKVFNITTLPVSYYRPRKGILSKLPDQFIWKPLGSVLRSIKSIIVWSSELLLRSKSKLKKESVDQRKLMIRRCKRTESLVLRDKPVAMVLQDDRTLGNVIPWISVAKKHGIFSLLVPFALSSPEGGSIYASKSNSLAHRKNAFQ